MKSYANFGKYLEDVEYDSMMDAIRDYVKKSQGNGFYSSMVLCSDYMDVDDIHVMSTDLHSESGSFVSFEAHVVADIICKGLGKRDYESEIKPKWYTVSFVGHLCDGLHMVTINDVSDYQKAGYDKKRTLSSYGISYLYSEDLEKEATIFLQRYCPEALEKPMAIPIDELLGNMCLERYEAPLPENVFGKSFFSEATVAVYDADGNEVKKAIEPGTILINPDVYFMRNIGSVNNTIVHECVHWDRHSKFFELMKILRGDLFSIQCDTEDVRKADETELEKTLRWMEWQANALTPRILMPLTTARQKMTQILNQLNVSMSGQAAYHIMETALVEFADFFQVSKLAAKIRLREIGFAQVDGVCNYTGSQYLEGFSFDGLKLKSDETYIIDAKDLICQSLENPVMQAILSKGEFAHVNNLVCINDDQYVEIDANHNVKLTDYAKEHVDECCVKFKRKYKMTEFNDSFYSHCSLSRRIDAASFCETRVIDDEDNQDVAERAKQMHVLNLEAKKITEILQNLPATFARTLDAHMNRLTKENGSKMTNLELSLRTGLSVKRISELRKNEGETVPWRTVYAICIALHLHPLLSEDLIGKARVKAPLTEEGFMAKYIIEHHYMDSLELCNQTLKESGYSTWGRAS